MLHRKTTRWLLASSLAAVAAPAASAQTAEATATLQTDEPGGEIVVTARRREESAQTVPVSITAFNGAMLREKAIISTADLTYVAPGINVAPQGSRDTPSIVIRGQRRATSGAGAPSVVTYFADVPLPNEGSILPSYDVGSIQILKGPQGTLFGRNTTGGAVLLYPQAPDYDFGGYGQVTLGSYNERTFEGAVNLPVVDNHVALRLAGQISRREGYTKNIGIGGDLDDRHTDSFRGSLLLEPIDGLKNTTVVDYYRAEENGSGLVLAGVFPNPGVSSTGNARTAANRPYYDCGMAGCDIDIALSAQKLRGARSVETSLDPYSNRTIWGIANTTTLDVGAVTFKNIFGYRKAELQYTRDMDGSALRLYEMESDTNLKQISNEFQILGKLFNDRMDWIVGAFYLKLDPTDVNGSVTYSAVKPNSVFTYNEVYNASKSKALFGQVGYAFGGWADGLRFNGGFRYTWDESSGCSIATGSTMAHIGPDACAASSGATGGEKSKAPTWTLGFDYKVNEDIFLYVTNRRGYRSAGFNQSGLSSYFDGFEAFKPETITDYEVGLKSSWRLGDVRGRFNIAAYHSKYSNIQRSIFPGANFDGDNIASNDPSSLIINAAKATIQGTEFDFSITPTHGLTLTGFGAYTDAGYDEYLAPSAFVPLLGANPVNNKFSYTPKWTLGGGLRYTHSIVDVGDLVFNANWFHSSKVWYVERPFDINGIQKDYDTVNLKLDLNDIEGRGIDLGLFVRNLFDVTYAAAGGVVTPSVTSTSLVYNEPRTVGVQLRMAFGKR
ncbi:TonB-dependent receptor [Sphingobium aquiterrae]|uniref:TonB-dependent receptor n=1 Tax=Sphingobium aquiterrae TaxID=2038656 RepID=UPI00301843AE